MVTVQGTLSVAQKLNSDSNKKSALLESSIGLFNVKYAHLNLLAAGKHHGFFVINQIRPICCNNDGKYYLELEADITQIAFLFANEKLSNQDNLSTEIPKDSSSKDNLSLASDQNALLATNSIDDAELFGTHWPLGKCVLLDVTQSRDRIRAQCTRLRELNYLFNKETQVWTKNILNAA